MRVSGRWTRHFRATFVNQRMADMLGYSVEQIVGQRVDSFYILCRTLRTMAEKWTSSERGENAVYERRLIRKDGGTLWTIVSETSLADSSGKFSGSFAMLTDITDRKHAEQALRENEDRFRVLSGCNF